MQSTGMRCAGTYGKLFRGELETPQTCCIFAIRAGAADGASLKHPQNYTMEIGVSA